jgi:hypothetical protein
MTSSFLNTNKKPALPYPLYHWRDTTVPTQSFRSWNPFSRLLSLHVISVHWTCYQHNPHNHIPATLFSHIDPFSRTLLWRFLYCGGHLVWCQNIQHPTLKNKELHLWLIVASYSQRSPLAYRANQQQPANRTHNPQLHTVPTTWKQAPNTTDSNHLYNTLELLMMGIMVPETCWTSNKICNKNSSVASSWHFISTYNINCLDVSYWRLKLICNNYVHFDGGHTFHSQYWN